MNEKILIFTPPVKQETLMPMLNAGLGAMSGWLKQEGYQFDQKSLMAEVRYRNQYRLRKDHFNPDVFQRDEVVSYLRGEENETISREANKLADHLEIDKYDIILMSAKSISSLATGLPILKERAGDKLTVIGGALTLTQDLDIARLPFIDYGVQGDGEIPLANIFKHELEGKTLDNDIGLIYGDAEHYTKGDTYRHPLDMKPVPHYNDALLDKIQSVYVGEEYIIPYQFGRGCTQNCSFCNYFENRKYQYKSIDKVVKELKELTEDRPNANIFFTDSNLFNDPSYVEKFAERMIEEDLDIKWGSQGIILSRNQEFFDKLAAAGCRALWHGIESASNTVLHRMRKAETRAMIEATLKKERKAGINTRGFFIVNFVGETFEEYFETIDFLKSNRDLMGASAHYLITKSDGRMPLYSDKEDFGIEFEEESYEDFIEESLSGHTVDYHGNPPEPFASKERKQKYAQKIASTHINVRNFAKKHPLMFLRRHARRLIKKDYVEYEWLYA